MSSCAECEHHGKFLAGHRWGMKWPCSHCDNGSLLDTDRAEPDSEAADMIESLRADLAAAKKANTDCVEWYEQMKERATKAESLLSLAAGGLEKIAKIGCYHSGPQGIHLCGKCHACIARELIPKLSQGSKRARSGI